LEKKREEAAKTQAKNEKANFQHLTKKARRYENYKGLILFPD